jgi:predicted AlkP superfamily phosphohydrolase/phosphomutase
VILVSWDGAGFEMTSHLLSEGRLPNLARMVREGAWTDGMVSSFPTKTAAAHAVLFTGRYGHANGITSNFVLRQPPERWTLLDVESGYFSGPLRVPPLWLLAARAGRSTYVFHGTQSYPFPPHHASEPLFIAQGYAEVQLDGEVVAPAAAELRRPSEEWTVPESRAASSREFSFRVGESDFHGLLYDDPLDPLVGMDSLGVVDADTPEGEFLAIVKPGADERFSQPLPAVVHGRSVWFSLRLFALDPTSGKMLLYRSGAFEVAISNDRFPGANSVGLTAYDGNGASWAYKAGDLGVTLAQGGSGEAEARFLETLDHVQGQLVAQSRLAFEQNYDFVVLYSPVTDNVAHALGGLVDPELDSYDADVAARAWDVIADGFEIQDRFLGVILDAAARDEAHVVLVSDHGMAGTNKLVHLNVALERAGLLGVTPEGKVDLASTRAIAPPLSDGSIAVNLNDREGGVVPVEEKQVVLSEVRRVFSELRDPATGARIVTASYEPSKTGLLQPGGDTTGDLFLDFAPGYYPSTKVGGDAVVTRTEPEGNHIFRPTRREMLAICAAWGPRVPAGTNWGRVRAIDIAPTVLDLLALDVDLSLPGRSLLPERGLLQASH